MYPACKLNKQRDNIQPLHTPFPTLYQFVFPYPVLTVYSWFEYRFLRGQIRWTGNPTSWRIFHTLLWSSQSKPSIVNEAEVDYFLQCPCFLRDATNVGNLTSLKPYLYICKFLVHVMLKPSLKDFEHLLASEMSEHNCMVVWTFFDIALLWGWSENWPFPVLWPLFFSKFGEVVRAALLTTSSFRILKSSAGIYHLH